MDFTACANSKVRKRYSKPSTTADGGIIGVWRGEYLTRWQFIDRLEYWDTLEVWFYFGRLFNAHRFQPSVALRIHQRDRILRNRYRVSLLFLPHHRHNLDLFPCLPFYENIMSNKSYSSFKRFQKAHIKYIKIRFRNFGYKLPQEGRNLKINQIWL